MSGTEKATLKVTWSLTGVVLVGIIWLMGTDLIFLDADYQPEKGDLIGYPIVTFILMGMVTFAARSVLRLVFEMRDEYCYDHGCECNSEEDELESPDEFAKDPDNPEVLMYPAVP